MSAGAGPLDVTIRSVTLAHVHAVPLGVWVRARRRDWPPTVIVVVGVALAAVIRPAVP